MDRPLSVAEGRGAGWSMDRPLSEVEGRGAGRNSNRSLSEVEGGGRVGTLIVPRAKSRGEVEGR
jgi:hypothetical protein